MSCIIICNSRAYNMFAWFYFSGIIREVVDDYFLPYLSQFSLWKYRWEVGCWKPEGPGIPQHPSCLPNPLHPRDSERTCCRLDWEASCDHHPKSLPTRQTKNDSSFQLKHVDFAANLLHIKTSGWKFMHLFKKNNSFTQLPVMQEPVAYLDMTG